MVHRKGEKTYVITAAQGIQNPQSANQYGYDSSKGAPNKPLIKNIERYVEESGGELQIHSIAGANVNEIDLHPFFHNRDDVYIESDAKKRNEQHRETERKAREKFEDKIEKWEAKINEKIEKEKLAKWKAQHGGVEGFDPNDKMFELYESPDIARCPYALPQRYFWKNIPSTDYPLIGKRLNSNVRTENIPIKPQNKLPLNGKEFLTKEFGGNSVIIGSPKRMMLPVAKGASNEYPHLLMTTGVCTHPNYNSGDLGYIAKKEHRYGFAVVDIIDDKIFLPRIVPAHKNGTFIDLGIKYSRGKNPERAKVSALDVGDSHFVEINPKINKVNMEMIRYLRPDSTFLNDAFAALSVNIHDKSDSIRLARLQTSGLKNLEKELYLTGKYISQNANLTKEWGGKIYVKYSNHDDMLYRWLASDSYTRDDENKLTAHKILAQDPTRGNCFQKAVKLFYDIPDNVIFLEPGEDVFKQGYLMSMHGHQGSNGARGSLKAIERIAKKASIGHGHAPIVWKDSLSTGTSTNIPLDYQKGYFSTSMAGNNLIYETGLAQSIPIIKSRWAPERVIDFLKNH